MTNLSVFLLATLVASAARAELTMPAIFGDNMVLQQKLANPVWGWDTPGTEVKVKFAGQTKSAKAAADGRWQVKLDPVPASADPATVSVTGTTSKSFTNVLVGEVWVCSGQSNMQFAVQTSYDGDLEILTAKHPQIRIISVPQVGTQDPKTDFKGQWQACSPQTVPTFSAIGFYYGRLLQQILDVPVGLIDNSWGGSSAEAWVRRDVLEQDARFKTLIANTVQHESQLANPVAIQKDQAAREAWKKRADEAKKAGKPIVSAAPKFPVDWLTGNARPGNIYNGVLLPTIGYGIKGVIWYQGESNSTRASEYADLFPLLITHWRSEWKQGDFPFYWVQLADYKAERPLPGESEWAELRESQTKTLTAVKNGGQAVITDLGEGKDIHPKNKRDVAERLARIALAQDYGIKLPYHSPEFKSLAITGNTATLTIDTFGSSLTTFDVVEARGLAICGEDHKWVWANGKLVGNDKIEVSSESVAKPVAVRYAWSDNPVCNVFSKDGLPLTPFRTDSFPMITAPK